MSRSIYYLGAAALLAASACKTIDTSGLRADDALIPARPAPGFLGRTVNLGTNAVSTQTCLPPEAIPVATDPAAVKTFDAPLSLPGGDTLWVDTAEQPPYYGPHLARGDKGEAFLSEASPSINALIDDLDGNRRRSAPWFRTGPFVDQMVRALAPFETRRDPSAYGLLIVRRPVRTQAEIAPDGGAKMLAATAGLGGAESYGPCGDAFVTGRVEYDTMIVLMRSVERFYVSRTLSAMSRAALGDVMDLQSDIQVLRESDEKGSTYWLYRKRDSGYEFEQGLAVNVRRALTDWANEESDESVRTAVVRAKPYQGYKLDAPWIANGQYDPVQLTSLGLAAASTLLSMSHAATGDARATLAQQRDIMLAAARKCNGRRFGGDCQELLQALHLPKAAPSIRPDDVYMTGGFSRISNEGDCSAPLEQVTAAELVALTPEANPLSERLAIENRIGNGKFWRVADTAEKEGDGLTSAGPGWRPDSLYVWAGAPATKDGPLELVRIDRITAGLAREDYKVSAMRAVPFTLPAGTTPPPRAYYICRGPREAASKDSALGGPFLVRVYVNGREFCLDAHPSLKHIYFHGAGAERVAPGAKVCFREKTAPNQHFYYDPNTMTLKNRGSGQCIVLSDERVPGGGRYVVGGDCASPGAKWRVQSLTDTYNVVIRPDGAPNECLGLNLESYEGPGRPAYISESCEKPGLHQLMQLQATDG